MNQFYHYTGSTYVPGGIVEATGHVQSNPRTGWETVQVRYPVDGRFRHLFVARDDLIACDPPENWPTETPPEPGSYKEARGIFADEPLTPHAEPERLHAVLKRALSAETHQATLRALVEEAVDLIKRDQDGRCVVLSTKDWLQRAQEALGSIPDLKAE
jgi:hypothetical protein